jgi:HEAT repeat protein
MSESEVPLQEDAPASERQTTPFLVLQFFIFPMAIVAVCVTVFVVFGLISSDAKSPRAYLAQVRAGGGMFNIDRWQAAFALANAIEADKSLAKKDPKFVDDLVTLFEESKGDEPQVRRYLVLALGRLGDPRVAPSLRAVLDDATDDTDPQTVIYSAWALGGLQDPAAIPALLKLLRSDNRDFRKTAAHALGALPTEETRAALLGALNDAAEDVRWNAALALARRGDPGAAPVLAQMMERSHLEAVSGLTSAQRENVILQAVSASAAVPDPGLRKILEGLRDRDPDLKVREAAGLSLGHEGPSSRVGER